MDLEYSTAPWQADSAKRSIAVLMSGGVDSSVTAFLLKNDGWNVLGVTMRIPVADSCTHPSPCCGAEAAFVCQAMGISHCFVDVHDEFYEFVIDPFRREYAAGRTPSPCIDCNSFLKFGAVWRFVREDVGIDCIATGHYAQVVREGDNVWLARSEDHSKEQSYFLYGMPLECLRYLYLPLAGFTKEKVRAIARDNSISAAHRPESMELCFAGEGDYRNALGAGDDVPGDFILTDGQAVGTHTGIRHYTIGQRKGLGVAWTEPLFVLDILVAENRIVLGTRSEAYCSKVSAGAVNLLQSDACCEGAELFGRIRSGAEPSPCVVTAAGGDRMAVEFKQPVFAPAPGQHLVLYDQYSRVVGGGVIEEEKKSDRTTG